MRRKRTVFGISDFSEDSPLRKQLQDALEYISNIYEKIGFRSEHRMLDDEELFKIVLE